MGGAMGDACGRVTVESGCGAGRADGCGVTAAEAAGLAGRGLAPEAGRGVLARGSGVTVAG
jgi:hypothetical protein